MPTQFEIKPTLPNTSLRNLNAPSDVQSVPADHIGHILISESAVKVCFSEQIANAEGELAARFVVNVSMARSGLREVYEVIGRILAQLEELQQRTTA